MLLYEKNFKITGNNQDPTMIPYNIAGLYKEITVNDAGELVLEEYFNEYDSGTGIFSDLVVSEARAFTRSPTTNWIISRATTITWYFEDNTIGCTKQTTKIYAPEQAYAEGKARRTNITGRTTVMVLGTLAMPDAIAFLQSAQNDINLYISGDTAPLIALVTASTFPAGLKADILAMLNLA
jgi:hypothetical protein